MKKILTSLWITFEFPCAMVHLRIVQEKYNYYFHKLKNVTDDKQIPILVDKIHTLYEKENHYRKAFAKGGRYSQDIILETQDDYKNYMEYQDFLFPEKDYWNNR